LSVCFPFFPFLFCFCCFSFLRHGLGATITHTDLELLILLPPLPK
jgi:hypothetical protein